MNKRHGTVDVVGPTTVGAVVAYPVPSVRRSKIIDKVQGTAHELCSHHDSPLADA